MDRAEGGEMENKKPDARRQDLRLIEKGEQKDALEMAKMQR
jgi:hypothetical protein